jgi:ATP-dependent Clp endopeptidase proteolytic subunit ClpP
VATVLPTPRYQVPDTSFAAVETLSSWASHSKRPITVRFFSYGGSVPSGFALYDFLLSLRKSGITITTVCMGTCMSMGGILLQAGDKRFIGESAMLMIHESSTTYGRIPLRTSEMDDYRSAIRIWEERLSDVLAERSIMTAEQIRERWTRDWFLSSHEAIQLGFADDIAEYPEGQRRGRSARTT